MNGRRSCTAAVSSRGSLRTSPARPASAPASRAAAVRACEQTSGTCPAPGVRATSTSSSPTASTDTRGPRVHEHLVAAGRGEHRRPGPGRGRRRGGRRRRRAGRPRRPAARTPRTARRASPSAWRVPRVGVADGHDRVGERGQRRTRRPRARPARAAGAADGAIRPGSPRRRAARRASARSPRRGRRCARRSRRSPPGRSPGSGRAATTSSALRRPCASAIGTRTGAGRTAPDRIRASCSSTDRTGVTPPAVPRSPAA